MGKCVCPGTGSPLWGRPLTAGVAGGAAASDTAGPEEPNVRKSILSAGGSSKVALILAEGPGFLLKTPPPM